MRILLFGKNGQVGWELQRTLAPLGEVIALDQPEVDFTDIDGLRATVREHKPDLIVNAAAYTAVDRAESEPETAMAVNGIAPGVLAEEAKRLKVGLVHYSTDYVFDGTKGEPYTEEDVPNPLNVYGVTKLTGDRAIEAVGWTYLILRTSWVYGARGRNFFLTIRRLARERAELRVVDDQVGNPTWCRSIAKATAEILSLILRGRNHPLLAKMNEHKGIYHCSSNGEVSWFGFANAILQADPRKDEIITRSIIPIPTREYPTPAKRAPYAVLSKGKIERAFGVKIQPWHEQLTGCWESLAEEQV